MVMRAMAMYHGDVYIGPRKCWGGVTTVTSVAGKASLSR